MWKQATGADVSDRHDTDIWNILNLINVIKILVDNNKLSCINFKMSIDIEESSVPNELLSGLEHARLKKRRKKYSLSFQ